MKNTGKILRTLTIVIWSLLTSAATLLADPTPIHISMHASTGGGLDRTVTFMPLDGIRGFYGTNLVPPIPIVIKTSGGIADTNLECGNYMVSYSGLPNSQTIFWPANPSITNLADRRIQSDGLVSVWQIILGALSAGSNVSLRMNGLTNVLSALTDTNVVNALVASGTSDAALKHGANNFTSTNFFANLGSGALNAVNATNLPGLLGQTNRMLYVDAKVGSDTTGNGTQEKPFRTVGYQFTETHNSPSVFTKGGALGVARPGDVIKLMPGDHTNQIVQLWCLRTNGISLVGDQARKNVRLWLESSRLTTTESSNGEGFVQLGNGSVVSGISFPKGGLASWCNPISDGAHGSMLGVYWADTMGTNVNDLQEVSCTNAMVINVEGYGLNDGVFLSYAADYDIQFYNSVFTGGWDQAALYGHDTNRINKTEWWNCTFSPEGNGIVHGADLHGGHHIFHNCTFSPRNGATRAGLNAGTYGIYADTGFGLPVSTNIGEFYNCKIETFSTNANSTVDVTNYSAVAGKSVLKFYNCAGDVSTPGKWTNWVGCVTTLDGLQTLCRAGIGSSPIRSLDGITADGAASFGGGNFQVGSGGSLSISGNTVIGQAGSITVPSGQVLDLGTSAEFSGDDGSFSGPIAWDASGNLSATTISAGSITLGTVSLLTGSGAPSASAPNGSLYLRTDGSTTTTLYVRIGGAWVGK